MKAPIDRSTPLFFAASLALGCAAPPAATPGLGVPPPGAPGSDEDAMAIAEVPYEPGALPIVPGVASKAQALQILPLAARERERLPSTTALVVDGERLGHDPAVAVGDRFFIVYTAHRYQIYDKATARLVGSEPDDEILPVSDFNTLFSPVWAPRDKRGQPNRANVNLRLRFGAGEPVACDPEDPVHSRACVREFYDSRILWDPVRRRFWIESAARNHLWFCEPSAKDPCTEEKYTRTQARRFIAIAVSRTEDPRKGFHRYILVDEYKDWPKLAVHDRYLLLNHRGGDVVHVFDADRLAAGNPGGGPVRVARLDASAFPGARAIAPVIHHGPSDLTYAVASDGSDRVTVYGLANPDPSRAARPVVIAAPPVSIGVRWPTLDGNVIYRDNKLYATWDYCVAEDGKKCAYHRLRAVVLPIARDARGGLVALNDPARGFLVADFGGREPDDAPTDRIDYEKPALDVNKNGDVVIGYSRHGYDTQAELAPEVRYSILYHGERAPRPGVLVRRGTFAGVPDVDDNGHAGIDLSFAQTDPTDDLTVWFSHAVSDASVRWYRQVTAAVRP